jgi:hypothetical protein
MSKTSQFKHFCTMFSVWTPKSGHRFWQRLASLLVLFGLVLLFSHAEASWTAVEKSSESTASLWTAPWSAQSEAEEAPRHVLAGLLEECSSASQGRFWLSLCGGLTGVVSPPVAVACPVAGGAPDCLRDRAVFSCIVTRAGPPRMT